MGELGWDLDHGKYNMARYLLGVCIMIGLEKKASDWHELVEECWWGGDTV